MCGGVEGEIVHHHFIAYVKRDAIGDVLAVEADELACFCTETDGATIGQHLLYNTMLDTEQSYAHSQTNLVMKLPWAEGEGWRYASRQDWHSALGGK